MKRRSFIAKSALATAGVAVKGCVDNIENLLPEREDKENILDNIIIGSGFGGGVAALRLTLAGEKVTLFERGREWNTDGQSRVFSRNTPVDKRSTWLNEVGSIPYGPPQFIERFVGILEANRFANMNIFAGAGLGGSSLVYGGWLVQPIKENFELVFPSEISYDELAATYYPRVKQIMRVSEMPEDIEQHPNYRFIQTHKNQNRNAGLQEERVTLAYDWEKVREQIRGERIKSSIIGESIYGNSCGSKITVADTYLQEAQSTGNLTIRTQHLVLDIGIDNEGVYWVDVSKINNQGRPMSYTRYRCHKLFVCAGTVGSNRLFIKAKEKGTLPSLNEETGRGWGNNGNTTVLRENIGESTGINQGTPCSISTRDFDNPITPIYVEHTQFPIGFDCNCLNYFGVGIHDTRGFFRYNAVSNEVELVWPSNGNQKVNDALMMRIQQLNQTNGGNVSQFFGSVPKDDNCFHPLGGMVLGRSCDFYGRVKNYNNLYCLDGATMPGLTACANPALTIASIAERNIEQILQEDF